MTIEELRNTELKPDVADAVNELFQEVEKLKCAIEESNASNNYLRTQQAILEGEIRGLKFAIRCNGVSGTEVTE